LTGASLDAAAVVHIIAGADAPALGTAAPFAKATIDGYAGIINAVADTSTL